MLAFLIINESLSEGIFPDALKVAKVVPIFKAGDTKHFTITTLLYRPISLYYRLFQKFMKGCALSIE